MDFSAARHNMVASQVRTWDVFAENILDAMEQLPREDFVPEPYKNLAYADTAIPLSVSQTMLPPKEQGRILQVLDIKPNERVLEICTGTGYLTALLAQLAQEVVSVDINAEIQTAAKNNLAKHHINNVKLITEDASHGIGNQGLFDVIVITGGLVQLPEAYQKMLNVNGRIFAILGKAPIMKATLFSHPSSEVWKERIIYETVVPMMEHAKQHKEFDF